MRNIIIAASITLFAFSGISAKSKIVEIKSTNKVAKIMKKSPLTTCYRKAVDDFGNIYYVKVPCPPVLILKAAIEE
jgi:hypothetical protein